ncbi:hypothetical protein As57867_006036, partial [Aphanomyces stellatus]
MPRRTRSTLWIALWTAAVLWVGAAAQDTNATFTWIPTLNTTCINCPVQVSSTINWSDALKKVGILAANLPQTSCSIDAIYVTFTFPTMSTLAWTTAGQTTQCSVNDMVASCEGTKSQVSFVLKKDQVAKLTTTTTPTMFLLQNLTSPMVNGSSYDAKGTVMVNATNITAGCTQATADPNQPNAQTKNPGLIIQKTTTLQINQPILTGAIAATVASDNHGFGANAVITINIVSTAAIPTLAVFNIYAATEKSKFLTAFWNSTTSVGI